MRICNDWPFGIFISMISWAHTKYTNKLQEKKKDPKNHMQSLFTTYKSVNFKRDQMQN